MREVAHEVLRIMSYDEGPRTFLLANCKLPFVMSYNSSLSASAQMVLMDESGLILLVVQTNSPYTEPSTAEARAIASAIAAYQNNNRIRAELGLCALDEMTIPCIAILGTHSYFYKVPVTRSLNDSAATGTPCGQTEVLRCSVVTGSWSVNEGLENVAYRLKALQYYESFKDLAQECWSHILERPHGHQYKLLQ